MQKKIIALAIAGAIGSIAAGSAFADGATIYGLVDAGVVSRSGSTTNLAPATSTGTRNEIASGVGAGSRIGFKGNEDLGNGTKAIFELEYGLSIDKNQSSSATGVGAVSTSQTNQLWNRHSYVGLTGDFGTALIGRVDGARYSFINKYDAFGGGTVANSITMIGGQVTRADNAVAYVSPTFADGFSVLAAYTTSLIGEEHSALTPTGSVTVTQNTGDVKLWVLAPQYNNGPLSAVLNFEGSNQSDISTGLLKLSVFDLGASYDFGMVKVMGFYDKVSNDQTVAGLKTIDWNAWGISAAAPVAANLIVRAGYTKMDDKSAANADCNKFGLGLKYSLSKSTYIATDYASIGGINSNGNYGGNACQIGYSGTQGSADFTNTADQARYGTHGFDLFISHSF